MVRIYTPRRAESERRQCASKPRAKPKRSGDSAHLHPEPSRIGAATVRIYTPRQAESERRQCASTLRAVQNSERRYLFYFFYFTCQDDRQGVQSR